MSPPLAIIVAAGTGGHLYPGLAVARSLQQEAKWDVLFVVRQGDMGKALLEREGQTVKAIVGQGLPRGLSLKWIMFPIRLGVGMGQALQLLRRHRPRVVIGMGGYLSFSMVVMAKFLGIRTLIHEQNVLPGIANRVLGRWADSVAVSFPESQTYFPKDNVWVAGLPIRSEIRALDVRQARAVFRLRPEGVVFLLFGGSLGAHSMNETAMQTWDVLIKEGLSFQVLHITGAKDFDVIQERYRALPILAKVLPYCHDMPHAYAAADVIVCRAGASTIAELSHVAKPAVLVPYPYASENHQLFNAEILMKRQLAEVLLDKDLSVETLAKRLRPYVQSGEKARQVDQRWQASDLRQTHTAAAQRITERITKL